MIDTSHFKLYIVMSIWGGESHVKELATAGLFPRLLFSYAYRDQLVQHLKWLGELEEEKKGEFIANLELLIDSGAFTVASKGLTVDLDDYISFLKEYVDSGFKSLNAICLDAIPTDITEECFDRCAQETFENYQYMKKEGIDFALPVYHAGEKMEWLDQIVESGCQYFAVGGVSGRIDTAKWKRWAFDAIFARLKSLGYTGKVHMLGLATARLLSGYPWYSADAAFQKQSGYGRLYVFDKNTGKSKSFAFSGLTKGGKCIRTEVEQEYILKCLNECGMELEEYDELDDYWVRMEAGFRSWRGFEEYVDAERVVGKTPQRTSHQVSLEDNFGK